MGVIHLLLGWQSHPNFFVALDCVNFAQTLKSEDLVVFGITLPVIVAVPELWLDDPVQNLIIIHCGSYIN